MGFSDTSFLETAAREASRPRSADPPWRWAEKHFIVERGSAMKGRFRSDNSPWLRKPMEDWVDPMTRQCVCMCARQASKSTGAMVLVSWSVDQAPADTLWAMSTGDVAKKFVRGRFRNVLESCAPVAAHFTGDRFDKSLAGIMFDNMLLSFVGSNSLAALQSYPYKRLILDELGEWKNHESLPTVEQSISAFWDGLIFKIGTPEEVNDPLHKSYLAGDQQVFHVAPPCGHFQEMKWEFETPDGQKRGMRWDKNDMTHDGSDYIWKELNKTIRYVCTVCGAPMRDDLNARRAMAEAGRYAVTNPNPAPGIHSYSWSALAVPWIRWHKLVEEFLLARALVKVGSVRALKRFITGRLAEPWEDRRLYADTKHPVMLADYKKSDVVPPEFSFKCGFVDVQLDHCWMLVKAFRNDCHSRILFEGKVSTFDSCHEIQKQLGVAGQSIGVDVGYEARAIETRLAAAKFQWNLFKEENRRPYKWPVDPAPGQARSYIMRVYSQRQLVPIGSGPIRVRRDDGRTYQVEAVPLFYWIRNDVFDIVKRWQETGLIEVAADVSKDYLDHNSCFVKIMRTNDRTGKREWVWIAKRARQDLWICEAGCAVIASMRGLVAIDEADTNKLPPAPDKK